MRYEWVSGLCFLWNLLGGARLLDPSVVNTPGAGVGVQFNEFQIVYPKRINSNSNEEYPSSERHFHKRSVSEPWDKNADYSLELPSSSRSVKFNLEHTDSFVLSDLFVQHFSVNWTWLEKPENLTGLSCFYHGSVDGVEHSVARLSLCDGMTGMFSVDGETYLIEPYSGSVGDNVSASVAVAGLNASEQTIPHLLYSFKHSHTHLNNTNGKDSTCAVHTENYKHRRRKKVPRRRNIEEQSSSDSSSVYNYNNNSFIFYTNSTSYHRHKRSVSYKNYVEVMVAADHEMVKYHGDNLQHYVLNLMSIEGPLITMNAGESLKRFCKWQQMTNEDENSRYHYDTAVLITRHDICRAPNKCDTLGLAELGDMCDPKRSCSIIEDNGIGAAFTIAHELGHVFGLPHDNDQTCYHPYHQKDLKAKTKIMNPAIDEHTDPWSWSECSAKLIDNFLNTGRGKCLQDKPWVKKYQRHIKHVQHVQVGSIYSADKQCELFFDKSYKFCTFHSTCSTLYCTKDANLGCATLFYPAADGTSCSEDNSMWCMHGECTKAKLAKQISGGWSKWSSYGKCTRTCGGGIKRAYRECNNPEPKNGGRYCTGKQTKYRHCNTKPCQLNSEDFRIQQCQEYNGQEMPYYNIKGKNWVPRYDGIEKKDWCKLYCMDKHSPSHFYMLSYKVIDGTKCRPDSDDICINGECRLGGCDNKLGSRMKRDKCGVCGGDNASCKTISGVYNDITYGYNNVTIIPVGATNIDIRQLGFEDIDDQNYLAITNMKNEYLLNGKLEIMTYTEKINVSGAILEYSGSTSHEERINSTGTIREPLQVQVLTVGPLHYPNIKYSYTMSLKSKDIRFVWKEDNIWTECNDICNGMRYKHIKCIRETDHTQVSEQRCENMPKPYTERERCNPFCTINWRIIRDECSSPCGTGVAKQYISCTLTTRYNTSAINMGHCMKRQREIGPRPLDLAKCQGKCVETHWAYSDWTKCTAACDGGAQKRAAECKDTHGNKLDDRHCNKKELLLERSCNLHPCPGWRVQDWTGCSVTCGHGNRHRKVTCFRGEQEVIDTRCDYKKKPTSKLECYMGTCPRWITEDWGECSTTCEMGIAIRAIKCEASSGQYLDDFRCDATLRPYETKHCNLGQCPTTVLSTSTEAPVEQTTPKTFSWTFGSWTQCSASCGAGIKQRYVTCMNQHGEAVDMFDCDQLTKPDETETCEQQACGYWRMGDWGKCSVTCGTGVETRILMCTQMDRQPASDVQCDLDAKPAAEQPCTMPECQAEDFDIHVITANTVVGISHWRVGPWSACSTTCGTGWQRRQVLCHDEKGPSDTCAENQKPDNRQTCDVGACPQWAKSEWSRCSKSCGGVGIQKRTVQCQAADGQILPSSSCDIFDSPPVTGMCNLGPCSKSRLWQVGPWSPCSVTCGTGHSQRIVLCVSEAGTPRPSTECEETKPRNTKRCTQHPCPTWAHSKWGKCSTTCGSGIQNRQVECRIGHGQIVPPQLCLAAKRPRAEKKCDMRTCSDYMWKVGNWSECSKDCGFGSKNRNITCTDAYGKLVNESFCGEQKRPKWKRRCSEFPCPFMWNSSPWSECSATCNEGVQRRRVACQAVTREGWIRTGEVPYGCKSAEKLPDTQPCNYGPCNARYNWVTAPWGECSTRCGHGVERRQVQCVDVSGRRQRKKLCPKQYRPKGRQPCYNGPCYASSCKQLKEQTSIRQDGSYKLFLHGRLIEIYCKDMKRPVPQEFLTLPAGDTENYAKVYPYRLKRHRTCPNNGTIQEPCSSKLCRSRTYRNAGQSSYSKIKIDIVTLKIQASDLTFAKSTKGRNIPFGSAGDCYSSGACPQGQFSINLSGTGLALSPNTTWLTTGEHATQNITTLQDGEVVHGRCGGLCGWCSPESGLQLQVQVLT